MSTAIHLEELDQRFVQAAESLSNLLNQILLDGQRKIQSDSAITAEDLNREYAGPLIQAMERMVAPYREAVIALLKERP